MQKHLLKMAHYDDSQMINAWFRLLPCRFLSFEFHVGLMDKSTTNKEKFYPYLRLQPMLIFRGKEKESLKEA